MSEAAGGRLVVMAAPNGARLGHGDHPAVPVTPGELARCARALLECRVSILHLHVRDDRGRHSLDPEHYRAAIDAIRAQVGDRMILQATTEAGGTYSRDQQMALVRELRPEAVSLALRELCPDAASEAAAGAFFREIRARGTWPQFILYSPAEVRRFERMRKEGLFGSRRPFALFVLGRHEGEIAGRPGELDAFLEPFEPGVFPWAACCFGGREAAAVRYAASLGGHVRIGFENNRLLPDGRPARDNAELVRQELVLLASPEPAGADWVRRHLVN